MSPLWHMSPCPRVMKFTILVYSSLVIITIFLVLSIRNTEDFKFKKINFTLFTQILFPLGIDFYFSFLYPTDATKKMVKIDPVVLRRRC